MSSPKKRSIGPVQIVTPPTYAEVETLALEFEERCKNLNGKQLRDLIRKVGINGATSCLNKPCSQIISCLKRKQLMSLNKHSQENPYKM
jgi:hypothetical protein